MAFAFPPIWNGLRYFAVNLFVCFADSPLCPLPFPPSSRARVCNVYFAWMVQYFRTPEMVARMEAIRKGRCEIERMALRESYTTFDDYLDVLIQVSYLP
jgi:hypothetical protein